LFEIDSSVVSQRVKHTQCNETVKDHPIFILDTQNHFDIGFRAWDKCKTLKIT